MWNTLQFKCLHYVFLLYDVHYHVSLIFIFNHWSSMQKDQHKQPRFDEEKRIKTELAYSIFCLYL